MTPEQIWQENIDAYSLLLRRALNAGDLEKAKAYQEALDRIRKRGPVK